MTSCRGRYAVIMGLLAVVSAVATMAARAFTHPRRALSIKATLVTTALVLAVATLLAFLAGIGPLNEVYALLSLVLLAQAAYYAVL